MNHLTTTRAAEMPEALLNIAREIEALKRECGMDPESPVAIQNGRYMAISHKVRNLAAMLSAAQAELAAMRAGGGLTKWRLQHHPDELPDGEVVDYPLQSGDFAEGWTEQLLYTSPQPVAQDAEDAALWRALPAEFKAKEIQRAKFLADVDAAIAAQQGDSHE